MNTQSLIAYYSWTGNTQVAAEEIQRQTGFLLQPIIETKTRQRSQFASSAFSALLGLQSKIEPLSVNLKDYSNIFLGCQVWAGRTTPAINAFVSQHDWHGKRVFLFVTKADSRTPQRIIDSLSKRIARRGGTVIDTLALTTVMNETLAADKISEPVRTWLTHHGF